MNDNWIEILPPIPPTEPYSSWPWLLFAIAIFFIPVLYIWYHSARQKSLRSLKILQGQVSNKTDQQSMPFKISELLRQCFKVNNIEQIVMHDQIRWHNYKQRLIEGCYSNSKPPVAELENLLTETRYWLKQRTKINA